MPHLSTQGNDRVDNAADAAGADWLRLLFLSTASFVGHPLLIRSDEQTVGFAEALGDARAIVMRGDGAVCVGETIEESVVMVFYLEEIAAAELEVMASDAVEASICFTEEQAAIRATGTSRIYERLWEYMTAGDPELG